jgi:hypothetical protein
VELVATRHFGYSALNDEARERLAADLKRARLPATLDQAVCVRNLLYKLQLDTQRESLSAVEIAKHYGTSAGFSLAACAAHFQTAPLEVVRAVVRHRYRLSNYLTRRAVELTVSFVAEDPAAATELEAFRAQLAQIVGDRKLSEHSRRSLNRFMRGLTPRDWSQFVWACQHDMQGRPKQQTMDSAEAGERLLEAHLSACGAQFRTERDLRLAQDEQRRSTPDILFDEGARVCVGAACAAGDGGGGDEGSGEGGGEGSGEGSGRPVRWIDMKNM